MTNNMWLFEKFRNTPQEARKQIKGGRLNGFTDINPMWRFKMLTEAFGPCGIGWKYEIIDQRVITGSGGEMAAFVDILLYYKVDDKWSDGIPGIGGSAFMAAESKGLRMSDECFKMALTDAIGTACKALGMSADIYFEKDRSKYSQSKPEQDGGANSQQDAWTLERAASYRLASGEFAGATLGEIWNPHIDYIRAIKDAPDTPEDLKNAIRTIANAQKRR